MQRKLAIEGGSRSVSGPVPRTLTYDDDERRALLAVADSRPAESGGPHSRWNRLLERGVSAYTGARYVVSVPNATTGMRMGLRALGIGPGDEVILPALDWKASAMTLLEIGATPKFADIDPTTLHMDPRLAEALISPRTRAVIVSHVHGTAADMAPWLDLCERRDVFLIEDPAQSLGAMWDGRMTGTIGLLGNISFNWKKLITTGDGGVLLTRSKALNDAVLSAANFGEVPDRPPAAGETATHHSLHLGGNERLNPLAAGVATVQLQRVPALLEAVRANAEVLSAIGDIPGFRLPHIPERSTSTYHLLRVILDPEQLGWDGPLTELRDRIMMALRAEGVPAGYWGLEPLSDQVVFRRITPAFRTINSHSGPIRPVDPESMPVTRTTLQGSVVLGRAPDALQHIAPATARDYVTAFEKIADRIGVVLGWADFKPLKLHPPIPEAAG